jgi:AcrR family transcriptional regulator
MELPDNNSERLAGKEARAGARRARPLDLNAPPTRERIILAAEKLFARFGIDTVSMRDIAAAAGQKNNIAVQYHFGDRDNLLRQIVAYRVGSHETLVKRTAARLRDESVPITPYDVVRDYCDFLMEHMVEGNHFLPFLCRYMIERGGLDDMRGIVPPDVVDFLRIAVNKALPGLTEEIIDRRWTILKSSIVNSLANYQTMAERGELTPPLADMVEDLVRFLVGGLEAPPAAKPA